MGAVPGEHVVNCSDSAFMSLMGKRFNVMGNDDHPKVSPILVKASQGSPAADTSQDFTDDVSYDMVREALSKLSICRSEAPTATTAHPQNRKAKLPNFQELMTSFSSSENDRLDDSQDEISEAVSPFPYSALRSGAEAIPYYPELGYRTDCDYSKPHRDESPDNPATSWDWDWVTEQCSTQEQRCSVPKNEEVAENSDYYKELEDYGTMSPKNVLMSIFTGLDKDEVEGLLQNNNYDLEGTLESIFSNSTTCRYNSFQEPARDQCEDSAEWKASSPQKPLCRYYLLGGCLRSDCKFSHGAENLICRFWMQGRCLKGEYCEFMHGPEINRKKNDILKKISKPTPVEVSAQESFPPLSNIRNTDIPSQKAEDEVRTKDEDFPSLSSVREYIDKKGITQPKTSNAKKSTKISFAEAAMQNNATNQTYYIGTSQPKNRTHLQRTRGLKVKWVDTGGSVAETYMKHRADAIECAIQRNKLLQRASHAYISGNKAAARAFSLGAHKLNAELQELHSKACRNIFEERNAGLYENIDPSSSCIKVVDLHGLHPNEALTMLKECIKKMKAGLEKYRANCGAGRDSTRIQLAVVTGTGNHSINQKAKILSTVRDWLTSSDLDVVGCVMSDGRGGTFKIDIR